MEPHPKACTLLDKLFPPGLNETIPPTFKAQPGPYWCFTRAGSNSVGDLPAKWCHHTYNVNGWANMTTIPHGRMDLYWLCTPRRSAIAPTQTLVWNLYYRAANSTRDRIRPLV